MIGRLEREQGSLRTLGRSNSICLYRCAKEGKFMLCVPKMQMALVPIQRKIKFNVVDTFIRVSVFFPFYFVLAFFTIAIVKQLHYTYIRCYISLHSVTSGQQSYFSGFRPTHSVYQHSSPIDYPNIWLDSSQKHYFGLFKGMNLLCTLISTRLLYFLFG